MKILVIALAIVFLLIIGYAQGYVGDAAMNFEFSSDSVTEVR